MSKKSRAVPSKLRLRPQPRQAQRTTNRKPAARARAGTAAAVIAAAEAGAWAAIRLRTAATLGPNQPKPRNKWTLPVLVRLGPDSQRGRVKCLWGGGPAYAAYQAKDVQVVKRYAEGDFLDGDGDFDVGRLDVAFYREYARPAPQSKPAPSAGWLDPGGRMFACRPWEHDGLARALSAVYYGEAGGAVHRLERAGWLRIYADGHPGFARGCTGDVLYRLTQAQLNALEDLRQVGDAAWQSGIALAIELGSRE